MTALTASSSPSPALFLSCPSPPLHVAMHSTSNRSQFAGPSLIAPAPPPSYVDPAQTHTHSHTTSRPPSAPKRKRLGTPEESGAESANGSGPGTANGKKGRDGPKKKKASRACFHCQKAHLTCDDCAFYLLMPYEKALMRETCSSTMSKMSEARDWQQLYRGSQEKSKVPSRRRRTRYVLPAFLRGRTAHRFLPLRPFAPLHLR